MSEISTSYSEKVKARNYFNFLLGAIARIRRYLTFVHARNLGKKRGAMIGEESCIFPSFARQLGKGTEIGSHCSINKCNLSSTRWPIRIGNYVIIGNDVEIIIGGHNIDSELWENQRKSEGLTIEDYVWICPHSIILPSCKRIGKGAVIGAGSVVAKDIEPMSVVGGNPAVELRKRKTVHSDLCVESLLGGDLHTYLTCRFTPPN